MKRTVLEALANRLSQNRTIMAVFRVDDNTIRIDFDGDDGYLFCMSKGGANIFIDKDAIAPKRYKAPFDMMTFKRFARAKLLYAKLLENERILRITAVSTQGYKSETTTLQLEFTGRHTNAILLDEKDTVLAALRYVDESRSSRTVIQGEQLQSVPPCPFVLKEEEPCSQEQLSVMLQNGSQLKNQAQLLSVKSTKLAQIAKKRQILQNILTALPQKEELESEANKASKTATLLLANINDLKPYSKSIELTDFDGQIVTITVPEKKASHLIPQHFFTLARKLRQKALGVYRERESLEQKIAYFDRLSQAVESAKSVFEIAILFPAKTAKQKKEPMSENIEVFWVDDYKILLGRNEKGNEQILKTARSNDIWMHLQAIASAHVLIRTDKQNVPQNVLQQGAKLCACFSTSQRGTYLVDFAKRKDVSPQEGAKVLYVNHKTIGVLKE